MNSILSYNQTAKRTTPLAGNLTDYYANNLAAGGVTPQIRAKWAQMDEGTQSQGAQLRQDAAQPGMFGQGRASRGANDAMQTTMRQNSANKLAQAQMGGEAASSAATSAAGWSNQQDATDRADRAFSYQAASDLGDSTTMAGLNQDALSKQGYGYTDYGQNQLTSQAAQQKEDSDWQRSQQKEEWELAKAERNKALKGQERDWTDYLSGGLSLGLNAASALVPGMTGGKTLSKYAGEKLSGLFGG